MSGLTKDLRLIFQEISAAFSGRNVREGWTVAQHRVLSTIRDIGRPCTMREVVAKSGVDRSTMSDMIARQRKRGYIKTAEGPDARSVHVSLTAEGARILSAQIEALAEIEAQVLGRIRAPDRFMADLAVLAKTSEPETPQKSGRASRRTTPETANNP